MRSKRSNKAKRQNQSDSSRIIKCTNTSDLDQKNQESAICNHSTSLASSINNQLSKSSSNLICSGCNKLIKRDKFVLKACDKYWHESCLKCDKCQAKLAELGNTLYCKSNMHLCRHDYLELFGQAGFCSVCNKTIRAYEMVMRAKENVYHLECFACQLCNLRFCVGERFYLYENKIVCQYDYDEHILQMDKSSSDDTVAKESNESYSNTMVEYSAINAGGTSMSNQLCDLDQSTLLVE